MTGAASSSRQGCWAQPGVPFSAHQPGSIYAVRCGTVQLTLFISLPPGIMLALCSLKLKMIVLLILYRFLVIQGTRLQTGRSHPWWVCFPQWNKSAILEMLSEFVGLSHKANTMMTGGAKSLLAKQDTSVRCRRLGRLRLCRNGPGGVSVGPGFRDIKVGTSRNRWKTDRDEGLFLCFGG